MYMDMSVVEVEEEEVALVRDVKPALEWLCQNMEDGGAGGDTSLLSPCPRGTEGRCLHPGGR